MNSTTTADAAQTSSSTNSLNIPTSNGVVEPLQRSKEVATWTLARFKELIQILNSSNIQKSSKGPLSTKRLRIGLNSLRNNPHDGTDTSLPNDADRNKVIETIRNILKQRLDYLLSISIEKSRIRVLAKEHAQSGLRKISLSLSVHYKGKFIHSQKSRSI